MKMQAGKFYECLAVLPTAMNFGAKDQRNHKRKCSYFKIPPKKLSMLRMKTSGEIRTRGGVHVE
jgi:hypothetical protein